MWWAAYLFNFNFYFILENHVITRQQDFLTLVQHEKLNITVHDVYRNTAARGRLKRIDECRAILHSHMHHKNSNRNGKIYLVQLSHYIKLYFERSQFQVKEIDSKHVHYRACILRLKLSSNWTVGIVVKCNCFVYCHKCVFAKYL